MYCHDYSGFSEEHSLGIAIRLQHGVETHIGLIFRDGESTPQILHLEQHYKLTKELLSENFSFIEIQSLDPLNQIHLAAHCSVIYELNCENTIPFAPCGGGNFDESGNYSGNIGEGLTCSLFVKKIFESQGYEILDESNWPVRDEDIEWQKDIMMAFEEYKASCKEHIRLQTDLIGTALRFRPEEIAAAMVFHEHLPTFEEIIPVAEEIMRELKN